MRTKEQTINDIWLIAREWEHLYEKSGGPYSFKTERTDSIAWRFPPLLTKLEIHGVPVMSLTLEPYLSPMPDLGVILLWDQMKSLIAGNARVAQVRRLCMYALHPMLIQEAKDLPSLAALVLILFSTGRRLDVTKESTSLTLADGKVLRTDHTMIDDVPFKRPGRRGTATFQRFWGKPIFPSGNTLLAYTAYKRIGIPIGHLDIVFSLAVRMGREVEALLNRKFSCVVDDVVLGDVHDPVLAEALSLVQTSVDNPVKKLVRMLVPEYCDAREFVKLFGNYSLRASKAYLETNRQKHIKNLRVIHKKRYSGIEYDSSLLRQSQRFFGV